MTETQPGGHETSDTGTSASGTTAGATFDATRDELVGDRPLLGSAEIARSYCSIADRVVSVVAITSGRIRRVDCWLGGAGFVTHAAANDSGEPLLGSVCDRARAVELTVSIVGSLVGGLPADPSEAPIDLGPVGIIAPNSIPPALDWIVIVSANRTDISSVPERIVVAGGHTGLVLAPIGSLNDTIRLDPTPAHELHERLGVLIGSPPRSVGELLADD